MSDEQQPYVPAGSTMAELTVKAVVLGVVLAAIMGAANAYLALKAGLTALGLAYTADPNHQLPQLNAVRLPDGVDDAARKAVAAAKG